MVPKEKHVNKNDYSKRQGIIGKEKMHRRIL
jgi:hypothetical protein